MKKLSIIILTFGTFFFAQAQKIKTESGSHKFSTGTHDAVVTTIYEAKLSDVIKEWKKKLKDYKYEKVKDDNDEVFGDNILIKEWGNNPADFYTKFVEDKKENAIKMYTAVDLGGTYMTKSEHGDQYRYTEKMCLDFAIEMTKEPIKEKLDIEKKNQGKLEDQQQGLEKDKQKLQDKIVDYKDKIVKAEKDLNKNEVDLKKKKEELDVQKKVVAASSDAVSEQAKSAKKIHDKLEGQYKDLEKERKDLKKDIEDYNEKIKEAEKDIKKNDEDQKKKKEEIEEAKKKVDEVKRKLDSIN